MNMTLLVRKTFHKQQMSGSNIRTNCLTADPARLVGHVDESLHVLPDSTRSCSAGICECRAIVLRRFWRSLGDASQDPYPRPEKVEACSWNHKLWWKVTSCNLGLPSSLKKCPRSSRLSTSLRYTEVGLAPTPLSSLLKTDACRSTCTGQCIQYCLLKQAQDGRPYLFLSTP